MILQALKEYYDRKASDPESNIAPPGWEWKEIPLVIVLDNKGSPVSLSQTYEGEGKKKRAKRFLVPQGVKRTVGVSANLLWDNPEYCLGMVLKGKPERVIIQHRLFVERLNELGGIHDEGLEAVKRFLEIKDKLEIIKSLDDTAQEMLMEGSNVTFQLLGDQEPVFSRSLIKQTIDGNNNDLDESSESSICLVTGQSDKTARLHDSIKGVWGAQTSGANIISFNLDSFCSYGKSQGTNAPIGMQAMSAYTKALNYMLGKDSGQRMQIGDTSAVFWAEKNMDFEERFSSFFGEPPKDDPDSGSRAVESLFSSVEAGVLSASDEKGGKFYVLGLSPNASRISIGFWIVDTVAGMSEKIAAHFRDIRIIHGPKEKEVLSLFRLLVSVAVLGKSENIPPKLSGELMRSVLQGLPYPQTLFQGVLRRIKAEHEISYARAAIIKACLNRSTRYQNPIIKEELKMSLDENNVNIGYRLGRLFATLEKIQAEAHPGINATIRDRFYGSASGSPITVFGNLMRLKNHHLTKLENTGRRINFERLIGSIIDGVQAKSAFPPHLSLEDQGRFAIGYYHQMQDFYTKKENKNQGETHEQSNQ